MCYMLYIQDKLCPNLIYSILCYATLVYSILFYFILFYSILFYSILFFSFLFDSIPYSLIFSYILVYHYLLYSITIYYAHYNLFSSGSYYIYSIAVGYAYHMINGRAPGGHDGRHLWCIYSQDALPRSLGDNLWHFISRTCQCLGDVGEFTKVDG